MEIVEAKLSDLENFFKYLAEQLLDNGAGDSPLFQPIPKDHSEIPEQVRVKFRDGFKFGVGNSGWRKLWLAKDLAGNICGHTDLRHYSSEYSFHRVLLGMGVERSARRQGLGVKLVESAIAYCRETYGIDHLDLNVLSSNIPAKNLYLKCGFKISGEMHDFYRIDGNSVSEITMTLRVKFAQ